MHRRGKGIVACVALFLLIGASYYWYQEKQRHIFHVWFLDIGQGDSALVQFENGQTMLVDCGPNKKVLSELGKVLPFYIRHIDYVLATHPDLDHYGGCVDVLKNYQVAHVITNGRGKPNDSYWQTWNQVMRDEQAELITMASPTVWTISSDTLQFFSPDPDLKMGLAADDSNNYSIVFRLTHQHTQFLFTGDMEKPLEEALLKKYCSSDNCSALQADILKVGHHGSPGASSEKFIQAVAPTTAVISVGKNNHYGHPSLRVVRRLERNGANVLRTDRLGGILVP